MYKKCLIFLLAIVFVKKVHGDDKLNIEIFYETLCPDSATFITEQLYPVWPEISPYVNIKFIPFGHSSSLDNGNSFTCQHGPAECKGNRVQSCGLNSTEDQNIQVEFVTCFMRFFKKISKNAEFPQSCTNNVDVEEIGKCYNSARGTELQLLAEQETKALSPKFVPTIVFDGNFNQELQDASVKDFRYVVCYLIGRTYPDACGTPSVINI